MPLTTGTRLGAYEIQSVLGAGGMSACGHAEAAAMRCRGEGIGVNSRRGWGPSANERAPAAMPSDGHVKPERGISVSSRRGWGPAASEERLRLC